MPAGVDDDGLRWSTPYSEIIGTALGSIIAAIVTPHAARNVTPWPRPFRPLASAPGTAALPTQRLIAPTALRQREWRRGRAPGVSGHCSWRGARYHAHSGRPSR